MEVLINAARARKLAAINNPAVAEEDSHFADILDAH